MSGQEQKTLGRSRKSGMKDSVGIVLCQDKSSCEIFTLSNHTSGKDRDVRMIFLEDIIDRLQKLKKNSLDSSQQISSASLFMLMLFWISGFSSSKNRHIGNISGDNGIFKQ